MIKSFFSTLLVFFCFLIIETSILSNIMILPAVPDLMLIVTLFISLHNGSFLGETTGFVSGLMLDFITAGPFGLNCLIRTIVGFICGLFNKAINTSGFIKPAFLGLCVTLLKAFLIFVISFFFPNVEKYSIFTASFGFELLANTLLTPLIFVFLKLFSSYLFIDNEQAR